MKMLRTENVGVEEAARQAALILKSGGVILYPTDTVYGLGADVRNAEAIALVKQIKGREEGKPVSLLVADAGMMEEYGVMNEAARSLAERFLPGPLTLVLPATERVPEGISQNGGVGVRVPADEFCLALSRELGRAFTTTSANRAGEATLPSVEEILGQLNDAAKEIALIVDDGPRGGGTPSTVVSCMSGAPEVLREGALTRGTLGL